MSTQLSNDLLYEIFCHLDVSDLLSVSLSCRRFDEICSPLLYSVLYLSWGDVENIARDIENDHFDRRLTYFRKAYISPDGRGEWETSPKLHYLVTASNGCFSELNVTCQLRSSGWFKYIHPLEALQNLEIVTCGTYQNFSFDFSHISQSLPNLESISLGDVHGGFIIDPFPENGLHHLTHIRAENCEWQYPAKITDACMNSELISLELSFTQHMHAFAFSERFRSEFSSLPPSLKHMQIVVDVSNTLKWNPLSRSRPLPNLETVILRGFEFEYNLNRETAKKFPKLKVLDETTH